MHGYVAAPALAWSGWRLSIPGSPEGGQYHGYTGDDSDHEVTTAPNSCTSLTLSGLGDDSVWEGTALREGETLSDHVYRSPGEVRPRANASGHANSMWEYQTKRSPGYAESPGNYHALGMQIPFSDAVSRGIVSDPCANAGSGEYYCRQSIGSQTFYIPDPTPPVKPLPILTARPIATPISVPAPGWPVGATEPMLPVVAPVHTVAQPAPSSPAPVNTVPVYTIPPVSPSPSPTVAASPQDFLPATGQPLTTPAAASSGTDIGAWLQASTIWSAVPNWVLVAGGALLLFRGGKK